MARQKKDRSGQPPRKEHRSIEEIDRLIWQLREDKKLASAIKRHNRGKPENEQLPLQSIVQAYDASIQGLHALAKQLPNWRPGDTIGTVIAYLQLECGKSLEEIAGLDNRQMESLLKHAIRLRETNKATAAGPTPAAQKNGQTDRLQFDQQTLTIVLDDKSYPLTNPKVFQLYKLISEHETPPITRRLIRMASPHFKGDKTIPRLLEELTSALRKTIKSSNKGYWLQLQPKKKSA